MGWVRVDPGYEITWVRVDLGYELTVNQKNYDNMLSRFHLIPERHGWTDGRTDRIAISISREKQQDSITRSHSLKIVNNRYHYDLRNFSFHPEL